MLKALLFVTIKSMIFLNSKLYYYYFFAHNQFVDKTSHMSIGDIGVFV